MSGKFRPIRRTIGMNSICMVRFSQHRLDKNIDSIQLKPEANNCRKLDYCWKSINRPIFPSIRSALNPRMTKIESFYTERIVCLHGNPPTCGEDRGVCHMTKSCQHIVSSYLTNPQNDSSCFKDLSILSAQSKGVQVEKILLKKCFLVNIN